MATAEETRILRTAPSTSDLPEQARDVTKPGAVQARTKPMKLTEAMGNAPYLWNPVFNRGTAFSEKERRNRRIEGLLPPVVESIELQAARVMEQIQSESEPLEKFIILNALQSTNEALFYHVIIKNLEELAPVIYTPTVGEACQKYDRIFRQPLGMYFSAFRHKGRFYEIMQNWPSHNVQIIVVTDGGRILGLGDLGTNGMGIPVGKIGLYVAGGGFHPDHSLPAQLDCGTDTEKLLNDKFYLGSKEKRLTGDEHMEVVEEFCAAAQHCFPNCLIQFEDFQTNQAFAILEKMRNKYLCFNDDIQGTGGVVTAGFINGLKAQGTKTKDAKVLFYGAGSSAVGVANMIATLIQKEGGLSEKEAKEHIYMIDSKGLVTTTRGDKLPEHKTIMARKDGTPDMKDLVEIVKHVKPHAVVGLTGGGEAWGQEMIEEMCKHVEKPLVFPLSNPTSQAEITAENAYKYSKGKCIFAGGSPFDPVEYEGKKLVPGQANNVFIFPGVGFGSVMIKAKTVTDDMFIAAAKGLADYVSKEQIEAGNIYPEINDLRNISATVAAAVANAAYDTGNSNLKQKPKDMLSYIKSKMWVPGKSEVDNHEHDDITNHKIEQDVKEARQP